MSPTSSLLADLVGRLTDPHDRETYADLLSYFDSLPPEDEMFRLARLLGLLTLVGQRIPDAAAALTAELRTQTKATSEFSELLNERLSQLVAEVTEGVDAGVIARAMAESVRQAAGHELVEVRKLSGEVAVELRQLSRTARTAITEIASERAKLCQTTLDFTTVSEVVASRSRQQRRFIDWLLFLSGFLSGIVTVISYICSVR
jgi:hypothetical protein